MKKKNKVIIQRITNHNKVQKVIKLCDGIINLDTTEIICKGAKKMSKDIWTKDQKNYLDDKFDAIDKKFDSIDKKFDSIDKKFDSIDKKFDAIDKKFDAIDKKFDSIDKRFDEQGKQIAEQNEKIDLLINMFRKLQNTLENKK